MSVLLKCWSMHCRLNRDIGVTPSRKNRLGQGRKIKGLLSWKIMRVVFTGRLKRTGGYIKRFQRSRFQQYSGFWICIDTNAMKNGISSSLLPSNPWSVMLSRCSLLNESWIILLCVKHFSNSPLSKVISKPSPWDLRSIAACKYDIPSTPCCLYTSMKTFIHVLLLIVWFPPPSLLGKRANPFFFNFFRKVFVKYSSFLRLTHVSSSFPPLFHVYIMHRICCWC